MINRHVLRPARFYGVVVLILGLLLTAGCGAAGDPRGLDILHSVFGGNPDLESMAQRVLELTNEERAKNNLHPLTWNATLAQAGADHCQDMIDKNYFEHVSPTGTTPGDRATAAGYHWMLVGENIAAGYKSPESVVEGWMNSPDHKENILRKEFKELGVGIRVGPNRRYYWAQEFGTPF